MAIQGNDGFWYNSQVDADAGNPGGRVGDDRSSSSSSGSSDSSSSSSSRSSSSSIFSSSSPSKLSDSHAKTLENLSKRVSLGQNEYRQGREYYYYKKNYDNAIAWFDKQISIGGGDFGDPYYLRGMCHLAKGNREQAIADFKIQAEKDIELIRKDIIAVSLASKQLNELKENPNLGTSPLSPAPQQQPSSSISSSSETLPLDPNFTGKGKYVWPTGNIYEGDWVNGNRHGKGKYIWKNGDVFEGDFVNGNGTGTMTYANGKTKKGKWKDFEFKPSLLG